MRVHLNVCLNLGVLIVLSMVVYVLGRILGIVVLMEAQGVV
jgi:hypothetical protein